MLKLLLIYYEPQPSGQTTHVLSLAHGLDKRHYDLTVVLPENLHQSIAAFKRAGVRVVPLALRKIIWKPQAILALASLIRQQDFDIVHVHSQEAGLLARIVARLAGAPTVIYTPQTIDIRRTRWQWLYTLVELALSRITTAIISVNESDRKRLIGWGIPPQKVMTIPNGIDLGEFATPPDGARVREALGFGKGHPLIMQVGQLRAQKAPLAFAEGAVQVLRKCPHAQFVLVGDGPLKEAVAVRIRELGLDEHVHLLGWCNEAFRLMPAADVVSLTSRWEGMPYALLEAMAWSRPVVATAVNGCLEVVDQGVSGYLVPPDDVAAWSRCVIDLLNDPIKAARMGIQGRKLVEERFSVQKMISDVEGLYRYLVTSKRSG